MFEFKIPGFITSVHLFQHPNPTVNLRLQQGTIEGLVFLGFREFIRVGFRVKGLRRFGDLGFVSVLWFTKGPLRVDIGVPLLV